jgi:hypothetical protein
MGGISPGHKPAGTKPTRDENPREESPWFSGARSGLAGCFTGWMQGKIKEAISQLNITVVK